MADAIEIAVQRLPHGADLPLPQIKSAGAAGADLRAAISAESEELGAIIAEAVGKVGKNGVVSVEESQGTVLSYEVVEGLEFDKGYVSAYLVTNAERMEAVMKDASILITDKKISNVQELVPLLEKVAGAGRKELVIIADDVEGDALSTFILNKLRGTFSVLAVKAPGYGDKKKELLADIATVVGAQVISEQLGTTFENATLAMLGKAARVVATKDSTTIVGGKGKKADIDARIKQLSGQAANTESSYDKNALLERVAKLSGGVAVVGDDDKRATPARRHRRDKFGDLRGPLPAGERGPHRARRTARCEGGEQPAARAVALPAHWPVQLNHLFHSGRLRGRRLGSGVPRRHGEPQDVGERARPPVSHRAGQPQHDRRQHHLGRHRPLDKGQPALVIGRREPLDDKPVDQLAGEPHPHP